jgi:hypothetical protein
MAELAPDASADDRVRRLEATKCYSALLVSCTCFQRCFDACSYGCLSANCDANRIVPVSTYIAIGRCTRTIRPDNQQAMPTKTRGLLPATASESRSSPITRYLLHRRRRRRLTQKVRPKKQQQRQQHQLPCRPLRCVSLLLKKVVLRQRQLDRSFPRLPCPIPSCMPFSVTSSNLFFLRSRGVRLNRAQQSQTYQRSNQHSRLVPVCCFGIPYDSQ